MVVIPMKRAGEPSPRRFVRSGVIDWFWQGGEGVEGGAWIVFLLLIAAAIGAALGTIVVAVLPPRTYRWFGRVARLRVLPNGSSPRSWSLV